MEHKFKKRKGGRPSIEEVRELTENIFQVATEHFLSKGYHATNLDGIARQIGTSKGALYNRFPDKVTLFSAVCERLIDAQYSSEIIEIDENLPLRAGLHKLASRLIEAALQPDALILWEMILKDAPRHPELAKSTIIVWEFYLKQITGYFQRRIEKQQLQLRNPATAANLLARMIFSPIHVAIVHGFDMPEKDELDRYCDEAILVFLGGMGRLEIEGLEVGIGSSGS